MKRVFEMPTVNVECFEVTDVVTLSGFAMFAEEGSKGSFSYFHENVGVNDTRLG